MKSSTFILFLLLFISNTTSAQDKITLEDYKRAVGFMYDNYNNKTYVNGQVGSFYKQSVPLANACRKPGEWQTFDIIWTAPRFTDHGILKSLARGTVFHNGVLLQNNTYLLGDTPYVGQPQYRVHGPSPIKLQSHGDKSEPISYRNVWLREL